METLGQQVKRVVKNHKLTILSYDFWMKYVKDQSFTHEQIVKLERIHNKIFPFNKDAFAFTGGGKTCDGYDKPLLNIIPANSKADSQIFFDALIYDHFGRPALLIKVDYSLQVKITEGKRKYIKNDYQAYMANKHHSENVKPYYDKWLDVSWVSDWQNNFNVNYEKSYTNNKGFNITGFMIDPSEYTLQFRLKHDYCESDNITDNTLIFSS